MTSENIGAKDLSARLEKVLNLSTTALTTCLCNVREHLPKPGEILKKIPLHLHLKSTVARPPICDRAYPELLSAVAPGNPVGITKPRQLFLFVQPGKKFLEESTKVKKTYFWRFSATNPGKKSLPVITCIKAHGCTHCLICSSLQVICITLSHAESATL